MSNTNVRNTKGTIIATVPQETIDTVSTPLSLFGEQVTGYVESFNENFVRLLENFASPTAPNNPAIGQLWFNTTLNALYVFNMGTWTAVGTGSSGSGVSFPSTGSDPTQGGFSAVFHSYVIASSVSALLIMAGGKIMAAMVPSTVPFASLTASIVINGTTYSFAPRFPNGLSAGLNLATDGSDYIFNGHVTAADRSIYVGGVGANLAAACYQNIAGNNVLFMISNGQIVSAYSAVAMTYSVLPASFVLSGQTITLRGAFINGIGQGITLSNNFTLSGYITTAAATALVNAEAATRTASIDTVYNWVDTQSGTSQQLSQLSSLMMTKTGTSNISDAIDAILATTGSDAGLQVRMTNIENTTAAVQSSVSTNANSIASLGSKTQAWLTQDTSLSNGRAYALVNAIGAVAPTNVDLAVNSLQMYDTQGVYHPVLGLNRQNKTALIGDIYGADFGMEAGRIVWTNGAAMKVQGTGFGTNGQFIEWFGPAMDINQCSEFNASFFLKTDGSAFSLAGSTYGNYATRASSNSLSGTAAAETTVFATHSGTLTIALNYIATYRLKTNYTGDSAGSTQYASDKATVQALPDTVSGRDRIIGSDSAPWSIDLYRSEAGAAYVKVATLTNTGTWRWSGLAPNVANSTTGYSTKTGSASGSLTFVDPNSNTNTRQYKAIMTAQNPYFGLNTQTISLACIEI